MNKPVILFVSYLLFIIPLFIIINFFLGVVTFEKIQGVVIFFPLVLSFIGFWLALSIYKRKESGFAKGAIVGNIAMFLFPIVYMIMGTVFLGV
ncbi:hypothetical protein P5663_10525 [Priestia flexa]|uniref:hypothetical protein n=1 Tax=Priestia flexa TaxID=86664 RepID=UPI0013D087BF|nr:hypothetical protein [Priestia flexa]MCG7313371.1 hypothetical protein [Priestia flexa]WEZ06547.1 hypothetical protein P5663_10525 [Priestia flexa]